MIGNATNIREIARIAGVSSASVSRALREESSPYLSEKRRRKILAVCEQFRYQPNIHVQRHFRRKAGVVALMFPPLETVNPDCDVKFLDANFGSCLLGVEKALAASGTDLLLVNASERYIREKKHLKMVRSGSVDGVLIWGSLDEDTHTLDLHGEKIPLALLQTGRSDCPCPRVTIDDRTGMELLTERALSLGHRRIAVIVPALGASTGKTRLRSVIDALSAHGIEPVWVSGEKGYSYDAGRRATREILERAPETTCILCPSDDSAYGCVHELAQSGLRVPEDVSVTGANGVAYPGSLRITSYDMRSHEIGVFGAELLLRIIDKAGGGADSITLEPLMIEGITLGKAPRRRKR